MEGVAFGEALEANMGLPPLLHAADICKQGHPDPQKDLKIRSPRTIREII